MGLGDEEAVAIWNSWGYTLPTDPQAQHELAVAGADYEHAMQELGVAYRLGEIGEQEWQELAREAQQNILGDIGAD